MEAKVSITVQTTTQITGFLTKRGGRKTNPIVAALKSTIKSPPLSTNQLSTPGQIWMPFVQYLLKQPPPYDHGNQLPAMVKIAPTMYAIRSFTVICSPGDVSYVTSRTIARAASRIATSLYSLLQRLTEMRSNLRAWT